MSARKLTATVVVLTVIWSGALALTGAPAFGAVAHKLLPLSFGEFTKATDVTVDQANGNVYVTDSGANQVDVFGAEGGSPVGGIKTPLTGTGMEPSPMFDFHGEPSAVAIDESGGTSNGDLYVSDTDHNVVEKFKLGALGGYEYVCEFTGYGKGCVEKPTEEPTWKEPEGVAVDSGGNVYVASFGPGTGAVDVFNSEGHDVKALAGGEIGAGAGPVGVAVDSAGDIYVNNYRLSVVKIDPKGHESFLDTNNVRGVAVDAHGNVFVGESSNEFADENPRIAEYNQAGEEVDNFGEGIIGASEGLAVSDATEEVYVPDQHTGKIDVFAHEIVPGVSTGGASNAGKTSATIAGTVNPDNPEAVGPAGYYVQYGTSKEYGLQTAEGSVGEGDANVFVSVPLSGLAPETTYHYRLVGVNKNGAKYGVDRTFTTLGAVNVQVPCTASEVTATSATLNGVSVPEGIETVYFFQYGLGGYEASAGFEVVEAGAPEESFSTRIEGLTPNTLYDCRVAGGDELGQSFGSDETFTTRVALPAVNDQVPFATEVALNEATLHGVINPGNGVTEYHFVYGLEAGRYTQSAAVAYAPLNYEDDEVSQLVTGLEPGRTYHYALVASNAGGTSTGPDEVFSTISSAAPSVQTGEVTGLSTTAETLSGMIQDPQERPVSYAFELGVGSSYGTRVYGSLSPGSGANALVSVVVQGLAPGVSYHYRLVASDVAGVAFGADRTFTTLPQAGVLGAPPAPLLVAVPSFPALEGGMNVHKRSPVKGHKRVKHKKRVARGKARGRGARSRVDVPSRGSQGNGRGA